MSTRGNDCLAGAAVAILGGLIGQPKRSQFLCAEWPAASITMSAHSTCTPTPRMRLGWKITRAVTTCDQPCALNHCGNSSSNALLSQTDAPDPHRSSSVERGVSLVRCPFFHGIGLPFRNPVQGTVRLTDRRVLARGGVSDLLSRGAGLLVPSVAKIYAIANATEAWCFCARMPMICIGLRAVRPAS